MPKKNSTQRKRRSLIRDLNKTAAAGLGKEQMHAFQGGVTYSCGHEGDRCAKLTVAAGFVQEEEIVIIRSAKAASAKIVPR